MELLNPFSLTLKKWRTPLKTFISRKYLREDFIAGFAVAGASLPLAMAVALASGVSPVSGLVTAVVGGLVYSLLSRTSFAISAPSAAAAIILSSVAFKFGVGGVVSVTLIAGILQVLTGIFRLGRFVKYIPYPVILGFTAGIGALILASQLPRAVGLPMPDPAHVCNFWLHAREALSQFNFAALALSLGSLTILLIVPKRWPRVPAALLVLVAATFIAASFGLKVETIAQLSNGLTFQFPSLANLISWELLATGFTLFAIITIETLASTASVDKLGQSKVDNSDRDLIAQGAGNFVSALLGGIPAAVAVDRSEANFHAGGKSRRSVVFQALITLLAVVFLSTIIGKIPVAVLAAFLLSIAMKMFNVKRLAGVWKSSKADAVVFAVTFGTVVSVGLIAGIQFGVLAALLIAALRLSQMQVTSIPHEQSGPFRVSLVGPVTFLASSRLESLKSQILEGKETQILFDLSRITLIDTSGGEQLASLALSLQRSGAEVAFLGASINCRRILSAKGGRLVEEMFVTSESEARNKFGDSGSHCRLLHGVILYHRGRSKYDSLFQKLSDGQNPHTLMITCSDSRIDPGLITSTQPGELFVVRNVGNSVPKFGGNHSTAEQAAVEYSLSVLQVKDIIVCGHSSCGAIQATLKGIPSGLPGVGKWLSMTMEKSKLPQNCVNEAAQSNVLAQIQNLMSYSVVRDRVKRGELKIHGWFFEIKNGEVLVWDERDGTFGNASRVEHHALV